MTDEEFEQLNERNDYLQNTIAELNQKWLDAIKDWKSIIAEKDKRIKELEEKAKYYENCYIGSVKNHEYIMEGQRELSFNLYAALAETLRKQGLTDDIPSVIDQLVGKNCGKYADMYNEYKSLKKKVKELEEQIQGMVGDQIDLLAQANKQLEDYKNAYRELCYYVEYEYPKKNDDIWYRKAQELEMIFLNKVKEIKNER